MFTLRTLASALCLLAATGLSAATPTATPATDLPPAEYSMLQSQAMVGSNIRKEVAWSTAVPMNRTYAQMTATERAQVHDLYERIEPGDEPPFPAEGIKPIVTALWKAQMRRQALGLLTVVADVDATGAVTRVEVVDDPDTRLSKFAAQVLLITPFKPAVCKGQPCRMQFPLSINMKF